MWARGCVLWSFLSSTPSSSPVLQSGLTAHQAGEACLSILKTLIWKQKDLLGVFFILFLLIIKQVQTPVPVMGAFCLIFEPLRL